MLVYQVMTRLWGEGRFSSFDDAFFAHMKSLGTDAVWYTGIPRHASGMPFVKGDPGSPYAVSDYFDTNPYLADNPQERLSEFEALVERTHAAGMKVITDFVPNHVSPDNVNGIPCFDGWDYDWSDTRKIDWSDPRTTGIMGGILRFWASKGVDGFRCDMVELVGAGPLGSLIADVRRDFPSLLFISEVYNTASYGDYAAAGFDLLYDKSGFYDISRDIICNGAGARALTWNWQRLGPLQPRMLNFLENHDEQRFASPRYASAPGKAFAAMAVAALFNGASAMIYFGQECGEDASGTADGRTSIFDFCKPASVGRLYRHIHGEDVLLPEEKRILKRYRALFAELRSEPFAGGRNYDLCWCQGAGFDPDRHFAFVRYDSDSAKAAVCNFSGAPAKISVRTPAGETFPCAEFEVEVPAWDYSIVNLK